MVKVMFVCHGNICRSPMAEFVFKDFVQKNGMGDLFYIASSATSGEETGNPVHYGTKNKLKEFGIPVDGKTAVRLTKGDYEKYDYLIGMETVNIKNMLKIMGEDKKGKVFRLLDLSDNKRDIADPWYTGNFDVTYNDILEGCGFLLEFIKNSGKI